MVAMTTRLRGESRAERAGRSGTMRSASGNASMSAAGSQAQTSKSSTAARRASARATGESPMTTSSARGRNGSMNTCSSTWPAQSIGRRTTPSLLSPGVLTVGLRTTRRAEPSRRASSPCRWTVGPAQWPPIQPFNVPSGRMSARAPGVPEAGWCAATTVARAKGRRSARRRCASAKMSSRMVWVSVYGNMAGGARLRGGGLAGRLGAGRLDVLAEAVEELRRELVGGAFHQACADAGDGAANVDISNPVHGREAGGVGREVHDRAHLDGAAGGVAARRHRGVGRLGDVNTLHVEREGGFDGADANGDGRLEVVGAENLHCLEAGGAGRDFVGVVDVAPDRLDRRVDLLCALEVHRCLASASAGG